MNLNLTKLIARELRKLADRLDAGTSEISGAEAMDIVNMLAHHPMSKETACRYLNISRSNFDNKVKDGLIPKGRKRVGFKELVWFEDELKQFKFG